VAIVSFLVLFTSIFAVVQASDVWSSELLKSLLNMSQLNEISKIAGSLIAICVPYKRVSETLPVPISLFVTVSLNVRIVGANLTL
jgi:hypothetical protein